MENTCCQGVAFYLSFAANAPFSVNMGKLFLPLERIKRNRTTSQEERMKFNKWTVGLAAGGVVSLASAVQADEAQKPMSQLQTAVSSTVLSGFVDTSIIWKPGTGDANLPGRAFDGVGKLDGFNLNLVDVTLEKPLSEDQWAAGYRVELLFGPDGAVYDATGQHLKDAYVALRVPAGNGIDIKAGAFTTVIGYESCESYLNPNYSRSFGWQLEPTQHTGLLASYKASDAVSISAGLANTWNAGINARATRFAGRPATESEKTYL